MDDEAVEACPPSARYRFRKFARRNKAAFLTGAVLGVAMLVAVGSLISGVVVLATSNANVRHEQQQTQQALEREKDSLEREKDSSYTQRIALAERELAAGNVGRAEELLDECPLDRRGWEWHFLKRQRYGNPPPMQHSTTVVGAAFSPDGRQLATATMDGAVTIRDSRTGQIVHELEHQTVFLGGALLRGMVYSPDGRYLAAARHDGKIRVWDPSSGQLLHTLEGHSGPTWQVAFSSDSRTMASGGSDRTMRLWDVTSGQALQVFSAHPSAVKGVAFRPDGRSVVAACDDGTVKVWDRETERETFSFHGELLDISGERLVQSGCAATGLVVPRRFRQSLGHDHGATRDQPAEQHAQVPRGRVQPGRQADRRGRLRRHNSGPGRCKRPRDAHHLCP